jgi:hypothetical protein
MEHFPLPLIIHPVDNGTRCILMAPFVYQDSFPWNKDFIVKVPDGFDCDYNSVPKFFWRLFAPWEYPEAGVVHDYLYRYNGVTRQQADQVHRRILELGGMNAALRTGVYGFLRAFASGPWNRYRAEQTGGGRG